MKRVALKILIAAVAISAAFGIYALVSSHFGTTEGKILLTTLCISGASILAMACSPAAERGVMGGLPMAGVVLAVAGFGTFVAAIWAEASGSGVWKTALSLVILAIALAHASLLALVRLSARRASYRGGAYACGFALAALILIGIWGEIDSSGFWRGVGVASILLCAFTILVPVFGRMDRGEEAAGPAGRFCPCCGVAAATPSPILHCAACGARTRVIVL